MKFKDFEIRPTCFLDGHTDPQKWDVVKWYKTDKPVKVIDAKTGKKRCKILSVILLRKFGGMKKNLVGSLKALEQGF